MRKAYLLAMYRGAWQAEASATVPRQVRDQNITQVGSSRTDAAVGQGHKKSNSIEVTFVFRSRQVPNNLRMISLFHDVPLNEGLETEHDGDDILPRAAAHRCTNEHFFPA
jgi:hypothetical protein